MDASDVRRLFDDIDHGYVDIWPDLRLLSKLLLLSSGGALSGHLAIRWHDLAKEDHATARLFPGPKIPGFPCAGPGQGKTNPFCWMMWDDGWDASACGCDKLKAEQTTMKTRQPYVYECHAGLTDIAVPVCAGETYVGTIVTGQVHREPPTKSKFDRLRRRLRHLTYLEMDRLCEAYMSTPVISKAHLGRTVNMLMIIADHVARLWIKTERLLEQERRFERIRTYERKELVEELISGRDLDPAKMADRLKHFGLNHFPTTAMVIRLDNLETMTSGGALSRKEILFDRGVNNLQDVIERMPDTVGAALTLGEITILTRPAPALEPESRRLMLQEMGERALDMLKKSTGFTAVVGIGRVHDSRAGLHESYQEALEAALRCASDSTQRVVHIEQLCAGNGGMDEAFWQLQASLGAAFKRDDSDEAADIVGQMVGWLRASGHAAAAQQRPFIASAIENLIAAALEAGCDRDRILAKKSHWFEDLLLAKSPDELRQWLRDVLDGLFDEVRAVRMDRMSKLVAAATAYMEQNRTHRLSIEEVAGQVGLSPWYFRRRFRDVNGVSFRQYQMQIRMKEASRLLLDPALSVTEVAMTLGYSSASQFARVFRRYVGVGPREYRAQPSVQSQHAAGGPRGEL